MFEFKESDPPQADNHRRPEGSALGVNMWNISRIALKVSADASLRVTKVPKFEPDAGTLVKL